MDNTAPVTEPQDFLSQLPAPGHPSFFPALVSHIHTATPTLPVDPVLLQSLLICLIASDKHLILRTREDDVALVLKLVTLTLSSIFGYHTHKQRIRSPALDHQPHHPQIDTFIRSLFLPTSHGDRRFTLGSRRISSKPGHRRAHGKHRSTSRTTSPPQTPVSTPIVRTSPLRSASTPSQIPTLSSYPTAVSSTIRPPLHSSGVYTEPSIHEASDTRLRDGEIAEERATVPRAVAVSGLEHAGTLAQRALVQTLADRRVVLDGKGRKGTTPERLDMNSGEAEDGDEEETGLWNLPQGFILVYVCPFDAKERPLIHSSLLDRFAMSNTITLHPNTRLALSRPPSSVAVPTLLAHTVIHPTPPIIPPLFLQRLQTLYAEHTYFPPALELYASDLFAAARHHHQLDGTLLGARARRDIVALARAVRVVGGDLASGELLRNLAIVASSSPDDNSSVTEDGLGGTMEAMINDENSVKIGLASWLPPSIATTLSSSRVTQDRDEDEDSSEFAQPRIMLDLSESDIARIMPRVVTHRLRVRDGPADEILGGLLFSAVGGDEQGTVNKWATTTVKDAIVKILIDV